MNFVNYEKAKKNRKIALEKPTPETNLFLEGELYSAVPLQIKPSKHKYRIVDYSTMPNLERRKINNISNEIKRS